MWLSGWLAPGSGDNVEVEVLMINIGQVALAPVALGAVLALVRGGTGRVVVALAIAALALLIAGVGIHDALTGPRSVSAYFRSQGGSTSVSQLILNVSGAGVVFGAGETVLVAATALALHDAARARRWTWFAALLAAQILAVLFSAFFNQSLGFVFPFRVPWSDLFLLLNAGDPSVSVPYFLLTSALVAASPLVALLYGLRARRSTMAGGAAA